MDNRILNPRQMKFCRLIAWESKSATDAYIEAGYDVKDRIVAGVNASRLLGDARVQREIQKLRDLFHEEVIRPEARAEAVEWRARFAEAQETLFELMRNAKSETVRLQAACEVISRVQGKPHETVTITSDRAREEARELIRRRWKEVKEAHERRLH